MIIGIYTRKSIYSDTSDSTEAQKNMCLDYAKANYDVSEVISYEDEGFTGANTDRPDFKRLMDDIFHNRIDVLICYKIDRVSRNVMDFSNTFNIMQKHNVQFVSVKEQIDTSTPLGRAMMYICSVFAQMERETISERVKDGMIELAKTGKWTGGKAPIGYRLEKFVSNGKNHTMLVPDEAGRTFYNMVVNKFMEGYSLQSLATHFRDIGQLTLNGSFFSSSQIHYLLKSPYGCTADALAYDYFSGLGCMMACDRSAFDGNRGVMVYGRTSGSRSKPHVLNPREKWTVTVGLHEPILSSDRWIAIQNRFGQNLMDRTRKPIS